MGSWTQSQSIVFYVLPTLLVVTGLIGGIIYAFRYSSDRPKASRLVVIACALFLTVTLGQPIAQVILFWAFQPNFVGLPFMIFNMVGTLVKLLAGAILVFAAFVVEDVASPFDEAEPYDQQDTVAPDGNPYQTPSG